MAKIKMQNQNQPVQYKERSDILDVIRGIAILGIFLVNTQSFSLYIFQEESHKAALFTYSSDKWVSYFISAFLEGKFYSLFSLLFGIGFTIILYRNKASGKNGLAIFYRRLFVLLLFGIAHALLVWDGDILLLYALIGMFLPLFRNFSDRTLIILAIFLIFSPLLIDSLKVVSDGKWNIATPLEAKAIAIDSINGITEKNYYSFLIDHPSYDSVLKWSRGGFFWRWNDLLNSNRIPKVLAMFLIGFVAGRRLIYARLQENKSLLLKLFKWGLIIGLPTSLAFAYFDHDGKNLPKVYGLTDTLSYAISVIPLSIAYATGICLLWLNAKWMNRLKWFGPVGRMALTNYILQSIIGITIYYGFGLGLGDKFGPALSLPIAVGIFILLVLFSNLWFRWFQYGPLEWIWRQLTYLKSLPLLN
jgi:uncharacterized protein